MATIAYKTIFSYLETTLNHREDRGFYEFDLFYFNIDNISDFGVLKLNENFISSIREEMFCDIFINKILFYEFISFMVKRKNVLFEKIIDDKNISNICKKLIKEKKIKSFKISNEFVTLETVEYKIVSMTNEDTHTIILF